MGTGNGAANEKTLRFNAALALQAGALGLGFRASMLGIAGVNGALSGKGRHQIRDQIKRFWLVNFPPNAFTEAIPEGIVKEPILSKEQARLSLIHRPTLGVVLAGGLARRLGGGDKWRIQIGQSTILDRVLDRLRPQCANIVFNGNSDPAAAPQGLTVVADSVPGYAGPLAGILAGLDWAAQNAPGIPWLVSVPSDCPFLPRDLVARLHRARSEGNATLACAESAGRRHPTVALWPIRLREELRLAITAERMRAVHQWTGRYPLAVAAWNDAPVDPFFNVNTPEDAAEAAALAARYPDA
jgi:molybdopterin-guanine dinucleotide biosynthesis protein A